MTREKRLAMLAKRMKMESLERVIDRRLQAEGIIGNGEGGWSPSECRAIVAHLGDDHLEWALKNGTYIKDYRQALENELEVRVVERILLNGANS